ncbi:unnamed protein product [Ectocarpus sp. CCAP 1310/34]|nr:unnamed protein product [Ectocarpus sp. CCAP 1310/34]
MLGRAPPRSPRTPKEGHRGSGVRRTRGTYANLFESLARQGDTAAKQGALSPKT